MVTHPSPSKKTHQIFKLLLRWMPLRWTNRLHWQIVSHAFNCDRRWRWKLDSSLKPWQTIASSLPPIPLRSCCKTPLPPLSMQSSRDMDPSATKLAEHWAGWKIQRNTIVRTIVGSGHLPGIQPKKRQKWGSLKHPNKNPRGHTKWAGPCDRCKWSEMTPIHGLLNG